MSPNPFGALQAWYAEQCNGEWEQEYGVSIETLSNPGWALRVDLAETPLEGKVARETTKHTEHSWLHVWSDGQTFSGSCGSRNLPDLLAAFVSFADRS